LIEAVVILRVIPLVGILAALPGGALRAAQDAGRPPAPQLEVLVDGSKHPELIPDRAAASAMLSSLVINNGTFTPVQELRIKDLGFNALDRARFRSELYQLGDRLKAQESERAGAYARVQQERTVEARSNYSAVLASRNDIIWDTYTKLLQTLTPKGAKQLSKELNRIKKQMKSFGVRR
jgi:hypothetical protein